MRKTDNENFQCCKKALAQEQCVILNVTLSNTLSVRQKDILLPWGEGGFYKPHGIKSSDMEMRRTSWGQ